MNLITKALTQGHTSENVLDYLFRHFPKHKKQIEKALAQGFTADRIIQFLGGGRKEVNRDSSKTLFEQSRDQDKENVSQVKRNIGKGALLAGGALASTALSRALPQAAQSMLGNEQPQNNNPNTDNIPKLLMKEALGMPPQQGTPQQTLTDPSQQPPVNNSLTPSITQSPQNVQAEGIPLQEAPPLPEPLQKQVTALLSAGNPIENIAETLKVTQTRLAKEYEKATGVSIGDAVKQFAERNPVQAGKPEPMARIAAPEAKPGHVETAIEPSKAPETRKTVALPNGDIGEITNIRQGIATVNVNGKELRRKVEELDEEPEGIEEATRHLMKFIPENEKSTAIQNSIHLNLPGAKEGETIPILLTKFWDGKIAWYKGLDESKYKQIALGTYAPKTSGKTSIGEYKPGVIDSRGAAFHDLVRMDPMFSKENKGKTWGYADNEYDALKAMQPALKTMSREKLDEKGNIVEKRERQPAEKSAPSSKLPPLHNEKVKEKELSKKLSKEEEAHLFKKNKEEKPKEKPIEKKEPPKLRLKELSSKAHEPKKSKKDDYERMKNRTEFEKELKKIDEPLKKFEKPDITSKGLKTQKEYILSKLEQALKNPDENKEYINIDVPGDGHFRIVNLKESLEKFSEKVEKKWPTKPLPSNEPKTYKR